jgi:hypothetical protein
MHTRDNAKARLSGWAWTLIAVAWVAAMLLMFVYRR